MGGTTVTAGGVIMVRGRFAAEGEITGGGGSLLLLVLIVGAVVLLLLMMTATFFLLLVGCVRWGLE